MPWGFPAERRVDVVPGRCEGGDEDMKRNIVSAAVAIAILPHAAHAAEIIGTRSGWEVFRNSKSCGMTRDYEVPGETQMTVLKYPAGDIRIMITNTGWSAKQGESYDISYRLNGAAYGGAKAAGTSDRTRNGFVSTFVAGFGKDFARGNLLQVFLSGNEIERLPLKGTAAAMALVDQCLVKVRASISAAEGENEERAKLPKDPFASH